MDCRVGNRRASDGDGGSRRPGGAAQAALDDRRRRPERRLTFFVALWHCVTERSFWYVFGWLIPLGVWRLKLFPTPWVRAAIVTSIFAILLGAYSNAGGTVGRATFNIIGPLLSLSVALLIARPFEHSLNKADLVANPTRRGSDKSTFHAS